MIAPPHVISSVGAKDCLSVSERALTTRSMEPLKAMEHKLAVVSVSMATPGSSAIICKAFFKLVLGAAWPHKINIFLCSVFNFI